MFVMISPAHNNILLGTATQCYLFCCDFQPRLMLLLLGWLSCTSGLLVSTRLQLFTMKCKVGKGFYSSATDAPEGQ